MSENPVVSVITPTYNRKQFLAQTLTNLRAQTLSEIEFIIIDDCSSDGSYQFLLEETKGDTRFSILQTSVNSGPSAARNFGLAVARGKYIGYYDADDTIPADYFASLVCAAEATSADITYATRRAPRLCQTRSEKFAVLKNGAVWDKLFLRCKINDVRFKEGLYCADNIYLFETLSETSTLAVVNTPAYQYALQQDSIGRDKSKEEKRKKDILEVLDIIRDLTEKYHYSAEDKAAVVRFLSLSLNSYAKDKRWGKIFQKKIHQISSKYLLQYSSKGFSMNIGLLKLYRFFHLIGKEKYNEKRQIEMVKNSPLFDTKWYLAQYPDVKKRKMSAAKHYVKRGWIEGRNPSAKFDSNAYLAEYRDVAESHMCPLAHYLISGAKEGRSYSCVGGAVRQLEVSKMNWWGKLRYALAYPIRLQEECDRLKAEIKMLGSVK